MDPDPAATARAIVLRQLTASAKSRQQLTRKLLEREIPEDVVEAVLDRFEEVRLVDDADFAETWVRSRFAGRKLARSALQRELQEKGIAEDTAAAALEQVSDVDEEAAARILVGRKLKVPVPDDRAEREKVTRRLVAMLARKGYSPSMGFRIVNESIAAVTDAENPET